MIDIASDLREFFRDRLLSSLEERHLQVAEETEFYVVELLVQYASPESSAPLQRPFVERLAEALESSGPDRLERFRNLGDAALCACGFFSEYLHYRGIERTYVISMGNRAYSAASTLANRTAKAATFLELAEAFVQLADALDDVREMTALRTPQDIVRLYDRWRTTGNTRLVERLHAAGVFPVADDPTTLH